MSYWCEINFKKMEEKDIIPFLRSLKKRLYFDFSEIAKDNYVYCPFVKKHLFDLPEKCSDSMINEPDVFNASSNWACNLFTFRYFYDTEYHLLGVFGVPNAVKDLFDASIEFQNSCDQDYEASHWRGVKEFEEIYEKWITKDVDEIKEIYNEKYSPFNFDKEYPDPIDASEYLAYYGKGIKASCITTRMRYIFRAFRQTTLPYCINSYHTVLHMQKWLKKNTNRRRKRNDFK